jgi:hypothetical protein
VAGHDVIRGWVGRDAERLLLHTLPLGATPPPPCTNSCFLCCWLQADLQAQIMSGMHMPLSFALCGSPQLAGVVCGFHPPRSAPGLLGRGVLPVHAGCVDANSWQE